MKKTFTGSSMAEVMAKVKAEVGDDALILENREIQKKTLTTPGLYEVVVEVEDKPKKRVIDDIQNGEDVVLKISELSKKMSEQLKNPTQKVNTTKTSSSQPSTIEIKDMKKQIEEIFHQVKLLQSTIWDINSCNREVVIPPEFGEIYSIAKHSGMNKAHLDEIMNLTLKHMPLKMRENPLTIKRYFQTLLKRLIPIRQERELRVGHKKIMMFVGPTGVGKTTTIAKLAARFAFQKKRKYKVGIITLDTYRIGAVEQLMAYARMMNLSIETVIDPDDFVGALNRLKGNDIILIDTVGSSQHDKEKVDKLNSFLSVDTFSSIDVNLVLSSNTKYEDLKDIYDNFSILNIDTIIFTKLDETLKIGNIFSLIYDIKKPISYLSIGQEVPDDLIEASNEYIVNELLKDVK